MASSPRRAPLSDVVNSSPARPPPPPRSKPSHFSGRENVPGNYPALPSMESSLLMDGDKHDPTFVELLSNTAMKQDVDFHVHDESNETLKLVAAALSEGNGRSRLASLRNRSTIKVGQRKKEVVGPWVLGKLLGRGTSGRVRVARHEKTGELAAVKIIPKRASGVMPERGGEKLGGTLPFGLEKEIAIMKLMQHPHIVQIMDVWESASEMYIVQEFVDGGELFDRLCKKGRFTEEQAVHIFRQIVSAVSYCHSINICHRDLKPENILLRRDGSIKVVDFGLGSIAPKRAMLGSSCGSPHYAAPEVVCGKLYDPRKTDIWSMGVVLYALLAASTPFDGTNLYEILGRVKAGDFETPSHFSPNARDLIRRMLTYDPIQRFTMREIFNHPLVAMNESTIPWEVRVCPIGIEDIEMPLIDSDDDVDPETMKNLQTLHATKKEEELLKQLKAQGSNGVKLVFCLLIKYRNDHLENYPGLTEKALRGGDRVMGLFKNAPNIRRNTSIESISSAVNYYSRSPGSDGPADGNGLQSAFHAAPSEAGGEWAAAAAASDDGIVYDEEMQLLDEDNGEIVVQPTRPGAGSFYAMGSNCTMAYMTEQDPNRLRCSAQSWRRQSRVSISSDLAGNRAFVVGTPRRARVYHERNKYPPSVVTRMTRMASRPKRAMDDVWVDVPQQTTEQRGSRTNSAQALQCKRKSRELEKFCNEQAHWITKGLKGHRGPSIASCSISMHVNSRGSLVGTLGTSGYRTTGFSNVSATPSSTVNATPKTSTSYVTGSMAGQDGSELMSPELYVDENIAIDDLRIRLMKRTSGRKERNPPREPEFDVKKPEFDVEKPEFDVEKTGGPGFAVYSEVITPAAREERTEKSVQWDITGNRCSTGRPGLHAPGQPLVAPPALKTKRSLLQILTGTGKNTIVSPEPGSPAAKCDSSFLETLGKGGRALRRWASKDVRAAFRAAEPTTPPHAAGDPIIVEPTVAPQQPDSGDGNSDDELADVRRDEYKRVQDRQNWWLKMLKVKPATRIMCFALCAQTTRRDIMTLWKEWRAYGLVITQDDKKGLVMRAHVGVPNTLDLKEVHFVCEIRVAAGNRRRGNCVVRFTLEKGAVQSFARVVEEMERVFVGKALVIRAVERVQRMRGVFE